MGLFGGSSKGIDTGALRNILERGINRRRSLVEGAFTELPQFGQTFEKSQQEAGEQFADTSRQAAQNLASGLRNVESPDFVRRQQAKSRELAFRDLPAAQQQIRESLAATGGLGRGVAVRALQQPVLQAQQTAADQAFQIEQGAAGRNIARQEQALNQIFSTDAGIALQQLGIDQDVARTLLETGREDVLDRALQLSGIEAERTQGLLDLETLRQQQEIAQDQQKRARLAAILGTVGSIGGAAIGGGGFGSVVGSQLGGGLGGLAAGGTQPVDLSSALALRAVLAGPQRNPAASGIRR